MKAKKANTVAEWVDIISTLEARKSSLEDQSAHLKQQRSSLSLDIALGDAVAEQRANELDLVGTQTYLDLQTITDALEQAKMGLEAAQKAILDTQEAERRVRLGSALKARKQAAEALDEALATMAEKLMIWLATGDEITRHGGDGHASRQKGRLASAIWHSLISAGLNSNTHWKWRIVAANFSGENRPSVERWKPLADFSD